MNNSTELVVILDRSGSMQRLAEDTIGGFNSLIENQRKLEGKCTVTTVLFDNKVEILYQGKNIKEVPTLTSKEYFARGSTALLDAIGITINETNSRISSMKEEEKPNKVLVAITTDGLENSSNEYSYSSIKSLIEEKKKKLGWDFIFLGANIDAIGEANKFGIERDMAMNIKATKVGQRHAFESINRAAYHARFSNAISSDWKDTQEIDIPEEKKEDVSLKERPIVLNHIKRFRR